MFINQIKFSEFLFNGCISECGLIEILIKTEDKRKINTFVDIHWLSGGFLSSVNISGVSIFINCKRYTKKVDNLISHLTKHYTKCNIQHTQN